MVVNPSNKYGSKVDTFFAFDMYNLPLPVLPPADLTLAAGTIVGTFMSFRNSASSRVVDFSPDDNPYIRGLGLCSNLADGLVDAATSHVGAATAWSVIFRPLRISADLTGTITNVAGSANVLGTGTLFTRELAVGSLLIWTDNNNVQRQGTVLTLTDDTHLVLSAVTASTLMFTANTTAKAANQLVGQAGYAGPSITIPFLQMNTLNPYAFFIAQANLIYAPQGKITVFAGSAAVTGVGTKFLTDMVQNGSNGAGYVIGWTDNLGIRRTGVVASIADDLNLTLTAVAVAASDATNVPMLDLDAALRIRCEMPLAFFAYTIAIDPLFGNGTRRLSLSVMAEIEHTFTMTGAL